MNILIVDDELHILNSMDKKIGELLPDASRATFSKASEAVEYAENNQIDVAFLDINMRFMSGIEMAKVIQAKWPKVNLIFCTGYAEYALDAIGLNCSQYLVKPVTEEKLLAAIGNLRYPVEEKKFNVEFRCFGNFEAFFEGKPIHFKYNKTKELLAYLVDRKGADVSSRELMAVLFDDDKPSYMSNIRHDLLETFEVLGVSDIIRTAKGKLGIEKSLVKCDYYDYLDHKNNLFNGEYMTQYSFGEFTLGQLERN